MIEGWKLPARRETLTFQSYAFAQELSAHVHCRTFAKQSGLQITVNALIELPLGISCLSEPNAYFNGQMSDMCQ